MNRKNIIRTIIVIVVIGLLAIPKIMCNSGDEKMQANGKQGMKQPRFNVTVYVVKKQDLVNTIQSVGNLLANEEVELRSETQGRVVKINFEEGEIVKKGQLLVKINDADLQAQLTKAIDAKKLKEQTESRNKQLLAKGGISQETYDMSATDLSGAIADINLLKELIRRTEVIAPFDGQIGLRNISEGGYLSNANIIARLQDMRRIKVEFSVPEKYISMIKKGNDIDFSIEGRANTFNAKIYAIEPKIDPISRNILVRAVCDNNNKSLLPGSFAKVKVTLQNNPDALLIPTQSIVPILKGQKIYLVKGDSVIEQKIDIGNRTDVNVEVTKGIHEGDSVVVNGVIQMKQGAKVKVVK